MSTDNNSMIIFGLLISEKYIFETIFVTCSIKCLTLAIHLERSSINLIIGKEDVLSTHVFTGETNCGHRIG